MELTANLRDEYLNLFNKSFVLFDWEEAVEWCVNIIQKKQAVYQKVASVLDMPWYVVAVIHGMESTFDFSTHLHNGDPLTARTVRVPAGCPKEGNPPFTWEASAIDALKRQGAHLVKEWTLPVILHFLEGYNGWGYRMHHPGHLSPYLWSATNVQTRGKYVADGRFDSNAISAQVGCVAIIKELQKRKLIEDKDEDMNVRATWFQIGVAKSSALPVVTAFAGSEPVDQFHGSSKKDLIAFLEKHPMANNVLNADPGKPIPEVKKPEPVKGGWNGKAFAEFCEAELKHNVTWFPGIKYVRAFESTLGKTRWAWCGATMHWCWNEFFWKPLGKTLPIRMDGMGEFTFALVEAWQMWAQKVGWYVDNKPGYVPPAGAFVLFDWEQTDINEPDNRWESHIGCFLRMEGDTFVCAEGNTDNMTAIKRRARVTIKGFVVVPEGWLPA